jgi:hypothetical protein
VRALPRDSIRPFGDGRQPPEDVQLRVSRTVPGSLTSVTVYDPSERSVLQMVDTTRADTVRTALLAALAAEPSRVNEWFADRVRAAELRQAAFSYADLVDWNTYLSRLLFDGAARDGIPISAVGVNLHSVHIEVMVPTEADRARLESWLARADIPCGLVETELGHLAGGRAAHAVRVRSHR